MMPKRYHIGLFLMYGVRDVQLITQDHLET